jgi:hypothetical protein
VPNAGLVDLYDKTNLTPFDKLEEFVTENLAPPSNVAVGTSSAPRRGGRRPVPGSLRALDRPRRPHQAAKHAASS